MAEEKTEKKKETPQSQPEKKKSPLLLIIIIVIAGLTIGGGGTVTYLLLRGKPAAEKAESKDKQDKHKEAKKESGGHGKQEEKAAGAANIKSLEPSFIVNLAGGGQHFLKVDIALELVGKGVESEIERKLPVIKDAVVLVLSEQTVDSIADSRGKLRLKDELLKRLNSQLSSGKVQNIYFTSFVVQ